ncbi:MAG: Hdr-like menaquinol oxidoreductase cytochrome c subunit [Gammaproteobacteria bacterium]|nr:Hdr-like menaquinol oxidoreductase cytochrome c subunit [Gammaproteobacteria bacterium]MDH3467971.1 Hdr-like menaquinol oxidoreductase cytochrome c subunit [Gammaproteobacteria bacterium]
MAPHRLWLGLFALLAVLGLHSSATAESEYLTFPKAKGEQCVEPTDVMRRDHMKFLLHQRDDTVQRGIRTKQYSLIECIDCHAASDDNGELLRVDAPGQFCQSCHDFTGVKMDCFECHSAEPAAGAVSGDRQHMLSMLWPMSDKSNWLRTLAIPRDRGTD